MLSDALTELSELLCPHIPIADLCQRYFFPRRARIKRIHTESLNRTIICEVDGCFTKVQVELEAFSDIIQLSVLRYTSLERVDHPNWLAQVPPVAD
jgi:hypothetical protein